MEKGKSLDEILDEATWEASSPSTTSRGWGKKTSDKSINLKNIKRMCFFAFFYILYLRFLSDLL